MIDFCSELALAALGRGFQDAAQARAPAAVQHGAQVSYGADAGKPVRTELIGMVVDLTDLDDAEQPQAEQQCQQRAEAQRQPRADLDLSKDLHGRTPLVFGVLLIIFINLNKILRLTFASSVFRATEGRRLGCM